MFYLQVHVAIADSADGMLFFLKALFSCARENDVSIAISGV